MFEAYKVAVRVSLINGVSSGLLGMSRQFTRANADAEKLQGTLDLMHKRLMIGGAMMATGFFGLKIFDKALKPAEEYASTLNRLKMAGWSQVDIANAVGDAWRNTNTVITSTVNQNLGSLLDLKNILGDLNEARQALPIVTRAQTVLASSSEGRISGHATDMAYSMTKALDIIGAAKNMDNFKTQSEMMVRAIIATQGRVTPEAFKSAFQYARQAKFQLSDAYKYTILPTLIQENAASGGGGGGSRGVGPMHAAFYRWAVQGYINKKSLPELASLGLVNAHTAIKTTTKGTTVGAMKDAELAASNPFEWSQKVLIPAIYAKYGKNITETQLLTHINQVLRGNQLAAAMMTEFAAKPQNFIRDARNIQQTMNAGQAYKAAISHDPKIAGQALSSQWENFKTATMMSVVPVLIPALIKMTHWLNTFADWARKNQKTVKYLALGFGALSASLAFGGALMMLRVGFQGLGLLLGGKGLLRSVGSLAGRFGGLLLSGITKLPAILGLIGDAFVWVGRALLMNPIGLALAGIALAIAYVYKHWATIGPYVKKGWHVVSTWFREGMHWIGETTKSVWGRIGPYVKKGWHIVSTGFRAGMHWIGDTVKSVWIRAKPFVKLFTEAMGEAFDFMIDSADKVFHAISNIISKIWNYIANSPAGIAAGWVKDKTVEAGHAIARGVTAGLDAGDAWATREDKILDADGKGTPYVATAAGRGSVVHVTHVHLDGKTVAKVVTKHQSNESTKPQAGTTFMDFSQFPQPVGVTGGY